MLSMIKYHQLLQIAEQIEDIQAVVLSGISKLNDSTSDKKRGDETQFSPKKISRIRKIDLILSIIFAITPIEG